MEAESLAVALEREHRQIDGGIEEFATGLAAGESDPEPLTRATDALRRHIYLEEAFLFPPLTQGGMVMPVMVMKREHGQLWDAMDALDRLLSEGPDVAGRDKTVAACRDLLGQLDRHNSKEEPIIYPQADATLPAESAAELHDFLASGRMPEGWVCEQATR
ncbi:MAG TPA: hemerythrin domain-containing protein [Segeticoccus sp.]|uniref:hemerythrin domain-containing protein n=1 Tax=Segeticoccus sp. TaxID=2706531 RepID=UPI002D7EFB30|nr:hemerythrin domain-containing protein [Segeticoccus sp.]HET8600009.1 hemerythrin domain-containing protein [Segeticoccus sp.]